MTWFELDTVPSLALHRGGTPPATSAARVLPGLVSLGTLRRPLSVPGVARAENGNATITMDNADGAFSALFSAAPPLRATARIVDADGTLFTGVVTGIDLGPAATLTLEAGIRRPLTDTLPLRTTAAWGEYRTVQTLPWVYGTATLTPVQYDRAGRYWVCADHAIAGIDAVTRDQAPTSAWAFANTVDGTGHPVALLELAEPLAEGEALAVTLRGKPHPATGALMTEPADILWDLMADRLGLDVTLADLDDFRTATAGRVLGGVLADAGQTCRAAIDGLIQSVGGAWALAAPGIATLFGADPADAPLAAHDRLTAWNVRATCRHDRLATVLRVLYDYDHAAGRHRHVLQLTAPEAVADYGELVTEWRADWLRAARDAEAVGRRVLGWLARPLWSVDWNAADAGERPGDPAQLDHLSSPVSAAATLLRADINLDTGDAALGFDHPAGTAPAIVTTQLSTAYEPVIQAGASVVYQDGTATFTLRDDAGQPIAGATVTLDGTAQRLTDAAGRVGFPAARGSHVLLVEADGYTALEISVTL